MYTPGSEFRNYYAGLNDEFKTIYYNQFNTYITQGKHIITSARDAYADAYAAMHEYMKNAVLDEDQLTQDQQACNLVYRTNYNQVRF